MVIISYSLKFVVKPNPYQLLYSLYYNYFGILVNKLINRHKQTLAIFSNENSYYEESNEQIDAWSKYDLRRLKNISNENWIVGYFLALSL